MKNKNTMAQWWLPYKYAAPVDFENHMEKMAAEGWNVDRIKQSDSFRMVFKKTEPKQYRYVVDLHALHPKDYIRTYEEFGWELVGRMASLFVWRKEYTGQRPEAFTDAASRERRSGNILLVFKCLIVLMVAAITAIAVCYAVFVKPQNLSDWADGLISIAILAALTAALGIFMRKIYKKRDQ
ncbi:DUF2812 domain-containing protein [Christensenella timonensis]|uniref:DUF2812 domain-containing protein n=1 Tax=Christensenella timonensis TaxID=1816678 RepID=UPI0009ED179B|nr:DUF2812 domain-containing protein [Christensenella timonensis]